MKKILCVLFSISLVSFICLSCSEEPVEDPNRPTDKDQSEKPDNTSISRISLDTGSNQNSNQSFPNTSYNNFDSNVYNESSSPNNFTKTFSYTQTIRSIPESNDLDVNSSATYTYLDANGRLLSQTTNFSNGDSFTNSYKIDDPYNPALKVVSNSYGSCALRQDGTVTTQNNSSLDSNKSIDILRSNSSNPIVDIVSSEYEFTAIFQDGSAISWPSYDPSSLHETSNLTQDISSGLTDSSYLDDRLDTGLDTNLDSLDTNYNYNYDYNYNDSYYDNTYNQENQVPSLYNMNDSNIDDTNYFPLGGLDNSTLDNLDKLDNGSYNDNNNDIYNRLSY